MKKMFAFWLVCLVASCVNYKSLDSYKCLSCSFYLNQTGKKKYAIFYRPDKNKAKFDVVIDNVTKLYWMDCSGLVEADTSYYFITNKNGEINKSVALNLQQTKDSFYNYFPRSQELKFSYCSDLYDFLAPRHSCE